jgi:hypothetical protein
MKSTKIPITPSEIEPTTFQFVAQCLIQTLVLKKCKGKYRSGKTQMEKHERKWMVIR